MSAQVAPPAPELALPDFATPRTPSRRTHGGAIAAVARAMDRTGRGLMGWQRQVADVATEVLEDGSWAYPIVVLEVQRQAGKTHLVCPMGIERCTVVPDAMTWFTAQTRQDARDTFTEGYMKRLEASPLAGRVKSRRSNGSEGLWMPTGSSFRVFAPTPDAMHGKANELVVVDEAWAFTGVRGLELEQAILPTFTTTGGQLWIVSAAGTAESAWLRSWCDRGQAAVTLGRTSGIAYFRWGLDRKLRAQVEHGLDAGKRDPEAADFAEALRLVLAAHPAAGPDGTLNLGALRTAAEAMKPGEFLRAYGTTWTELEERVIPAAAWADDKADTWPEPRVPVALGLDVALDRSDSAVVAAWRDHPGDRIRWDVLERRPGSPSWIPAYVQDLRSRRPIVAVGHVGGPAGHVADELAVASRPAGATSGPEWLVRPSMTDYGAACAGALAAIVDGRLRHHGQPAMEAAVSAAAKREQADTWTWGRRESAASIAPLVAATAATWAFDHAKPPMPAPRLVTRRR